LPIGRFLEFLEALPLGSFALLLSFLAQPCLLEQLPQTAIFRQFFLRSASVISSMSDCSSFGDGPF